MVTFKNEGLWLECVFTQTVHPKDWSAFAFANPSKEYHIERWPKEELEKAW